MDKKKQNKSKVVASARTIMQLAAVIMSNAHLTNLISGQIYQGKEKTACVPGLNCYSCPAASAACPIGAFQAVSGSSKFSFSYYITGLLILIGTIMGRFVCGFLCPFGWLQELLNMLTVKELNTKRIKGLRFLKYVVLVFLVVLLPALFASGSEAGTPYFCKYVCPQGIVEGAMPMVAVNKGIRAAMGTLFSWKLTVLGIILLLSIFIYRPFCKWLCPLGAFYALFNRIALLRIRVDREKCIACGKCIKVCKMDVDVTRTPNHSECIRCGKCISRCPQDAVSYCYGLKKEYKNH